MKKVFIFIILIILITAMIFSTGIAEASTIKENRVPLAGGDFNFEADEPEETAKASPKTGDSMLLFIILAGISVTAAGTTAGIIKKSRAK